MLNIARTLAPFDVALVGVNQGRLGFLTDISVDTHAATPSARCSTANTSPRSRLLLASEVWRDGESIFDVRAFNDTSIAKGADGGLIELEVRIDGQFVYNLRADGLIVATPTGSTAYALSAGGPILHPALSMFALVPVCPHTLSNRPITISSDCADRDPHAPLRGRTRALRQPLALRAAAGRPHVVRRFPRTIRLLHPRGHNYYHMLREKLHWSEAL